VKPKNRDIFSKIYKKARTSFIILLLSKYLTANNTKVLRYFWWKILS